MNWLEIAVQYTGLSTREKVCVLTGCGDLDDRAPRTVTNAIRHSYPKAILWVGLETLKYVVGGIPTRQEEKKKKRYPSQTSDSETLKTMSTTLRCTGAYLALCACCLQPFHPPPPPPPPPRASHKKRKWSKICRFYIPMLLRCLQYTIRFTGWVIFVVFVALRIKKGGGENFQIVWSLAQSEDIWEQRNCQIPFVGWLGSLSATERICFGMFQLVIQLKERERER